MLLNTVKRPLAIAVSASLVAHLLIAGWLIWSLTRWVQPTDKPRVMTLQFSASAHDDPQKLEADLRSDTLRDTAVAKRASSPVELKPAQQPGPAADSDAAKPVAKHEVSVKNEQQHSGKFARASKIGLATPDAAPASDLMTGSEDPQAAASDRSPEFVENIVAIPVSQSLNASETPGTAAPAEQPLLATTGPARSVAAATPRGEPEASRAFSRAEGKMLERKLRKWAADLHQMAGDSASLRWRHKGQEYEARVRRLPANSDTDIDKLAIEVITERNGEALSTELHMKMLAFSHFAQFVHRWDPNVQIHNDTLDGRFHSNSRILLTADKEVAPRFLGKVTTASSGVQFAGRRGYRDREQIFQGGLETGVKRIPMRRRQAPAALATTKATAEGHSAGIKSAQQQVYRFEDHTHIRFAPDGSFSWYASDPQDAQRVTTSGGPVYLAGAKGKTLFVSGELTGSVLVYSPTRIVIEGNLTYAQRSADAEAKQAFLGLVSEGNVEIAEPEVTGPEPLYVHAAIYAGQKFKVRDYRRRDYSRLYIYGSLSAGTLSATEPRYATHIEFDRRLEEQRPPGYPVTNRFELAAWDRQWRPLKPD